MCACTSISLKVFALCVSLCSKGVSSMFLFFKRMFVAVSVSVMVQSVRESGFVTRGQIQTGSLVCRSSPHITTVETREQPPTCTRSK